MIHTYFKSVPAIGEVVTNVTYTVHEAEKEKVDMSQLITCCVSFASKADMHERVAKNYFKDKAHEIKPGKYSPEEYAILYKEYETLYEEKK